MPNDFENLSPEKKAQARIAIDIGCHAAVEASKTINRVTKVLSGEFELQYNAQSTALLILLEEYSRIAKKVGDTEWKNAIIRAWEKGVSR